jgi:polyhydroxybutyrate depolymerase
VLHGRYGTGVLTEETSHLSALADREGFVVVYPDGIDRSWHDRREQGPAADGQVDDVAFISSLIDTMVSQQNVDAKRVYVAGISNGAMMTFRLACDLSEKITAVGAVIGALPENGAQECKPSHPMPLVMFSGTEDPLVPYAGGEVKGHRGRVLSADATRARFAELDGCGPAQAPVHYDRVPDDETSVTEIAHTDCANGTEVRLFSIEGGGHTWPGGPQYLPVRVVGRASKELDMSEELWKFFSRQPAR